GVEAGLGDHGGGGKDGTDGVGSECGGDGGDAAAGLLREHLLDGELCDVEEAFEVGGDEGAEVFGGVVGEGLGEEDAGIVDEDVDGTEAGEGGVEGFPGGGGVADVAVDDGDTVGGADLGGGGHVAGGGDEVVAAA